jgi:hypothetical protein
MHVDGASHPTKYVKVAVCASCQSWLNETFEQPGKTLIEAAGLGEPLVLGEAKQEFLAAYITKFVLLLNLWSGGPPAPEIRPGDYRRFRRTGRPLPESAVWVACINDQPYPVEEVVRAIPEIYQTYTPQQLLPGTAGGGVDMRRLSALWFRGQEVVAQEYLAGSSLDILRRGEEVGLLVRLWPIASEVQVLPPRHGLDAHTARFLRTLFFHLDLPPD